MLNIRPYSNKELLLFPPSVGDYLSKNHLAHVVDEAVELIDLTPYYGKISSVGNPAYDPALMIKTWFYGYCVRTYSSRKVEERLDTDVAFIYLAGMQKPDFRTLSDFRKNNLSELKNSFVDILKICHRLGLTKLGNISIDSKVMKANASASQTYTEDELNKEHQELEKSIQEYLQKANQIDDEEDKKYGSDKRGTELPKDIQNKEQRINKMKQIAQQLKQAQQKLKQSDKKKINLTDEDAQFQKGAGKIVPGYRAEIAVDSKEQIIVTNDVTNEQHDSSRLIPMINKTLENVKELEPDKFSGDNENKEPIKLLADAGYSSGKNLSELEKEQYKEKIEPYIPDTNSQTKERGKGHDVNSPFHRSKFVYNEKKNNFTCPAGKTLYYMGQYLSHNVLYSVYRCRDCKSCPHFGKCTINKLGRFIQISEHQHLIDKMRKKLDTPDGKKIYGKRKITAEPVFGNLSHNLGFREFLLRGTQKVKGEFSLMCSAHNILKIAKVLRNLGMTLKEAFALTELLPAMDSS